MKHFLVVHEVGHPVHAPDAINFAVFLRRSQPLYFPPLVLNFYQYLKPIEYLNIGAYI